MKPDHEHGDDLALLIMCAVIVIVITIVVFASIFALSDRLDVLEATLTPTPAATEVRP